ncbi:MAG: DUF4340 domain-containing protein [Gammaproteobacteria bacterium]|nr:DUF4340 domain-containing protein [Gammaproteobacteria bacterium]
MSRLGILNLLLFVTLLGLGAFVYFAPTPSKETPQQSFDAVNAEQVTQILLQRNNLDDVKLEKINGHWMLNYRQQMLPAHQWRIDNLLQLLQAKSEHRFDTQEPGKFGLAPPRAQIRFNDYTLLIGDNDPIQRQRYIAHNNTVMLVTDQYYIHLFADLTNYLSLSPLDDLTITDVRIQQANITLQSDERKAWLDQWRHLQALQVIAAQDITSGRNIDIIYGNGQQLSLLLQDKFLVRPDLALAYELNDLQLQSLLQPQ